MDPAWAGRPVGSAATMLEGYEWNRLRSIMVANGPRLQLGELAIAEDRHRILRGRDALSESIDPRAAVDRLFLLSGQIDPQDRWTTDFSMVMPAAGLPPSVPTRGEYAVVLRDASGTELLRWPFDVSFEVTHGSPPSILPLSFVVPYPDSTALVQVVHGPALLAELRQPAQGPSVSFQSVSVAGSTIQSQWSGSHPDEAPLTYSLFYSPDGGVSRIPVAPGLTTTTYTWTTEMLPGSADARLIVMASDGFNTAEAQSAPFSLPRRPPMVAITAPVPGTSLTSGATENPPLPLVAGAPILLRGVGFDSNDGLLQDEALRWASSLDGPLGIGDALTVTLSAGTHVLTLQGISSAGLVGSDTVTLTVLSTPPPTPAPTAPPLPTLAPEPSPIAFSGCALSPSLSQTIHLAGVDVPYRATASAPWLTVARDENGDLQVSVLCADLPVPSPAGQIFVTAQDRQPLVIPVTIEQEPEQVNPPATVQGRSPGQ